MPQERVASSPACIVSGLFGLVGAAQLNQPSAVAVCSAPRPQRDRNVSPVEYLDAVEARDRGEIGPASDQGGRSGPPRRDRHPEGQELPPSRAHLCGRARRPYRPMHF